MPTNHGTPIRIHRTIHCAQCDGTADVKFVRRTSQSTAQGQVLDEFVCDDEHTSLLPGLDWTPPGDGTVFDL